jgi:hypothetical protein
MKLYRDCLGMLEPRATLSPWRISDPRGQTDKRYIYAKVVDHWFLTTTSDAPRGEWPTLDVAREWLEANGYSVSAEAIDYNCDYDVIHLATAQALDELLAANDAKWANATDCYVRYGRLPKGQRSRNHADDTLEAGVSVYRGQLLPTGEARALPATNAEFCGLLTINSRTLYVVAGDLVGTGSDGEPVLRNCKIVAESNA